MPSLSMRSLLKAMASTLRVRRVPSAQPACRRDHPSFMTRRSPVLAVYSIRPDFLAVPPQECQGFAVDRVNGQHSPIGGTDGRTGQDSGGIERFFGRAFRFFGLQRPQACGWTAVVQRVTLTYAAAVVVALAAHRAGRPDPIRSPKRVLAHLWEG